MSEVTQILSAIEQGDPRAAEQLLPLVYDELRKLAAAKLAQEKPGQTLQATALVHEAYLRLVGHQAPGADQPAPGWNSRGHFFAAAAEAMRRILVEIARRKMTYKHGGKFEAADLNAIAAKFDSKPADLLLLHDALTRLQADDATAAELVKLRVFAGLSAGEAAQALGLPRTTADRHWTYGRAWLNSQLHDAGSHSG
jgi:RNA polymerase sigma factor (TIGR02999 family)